MKRRLAFILPILLIIGALLACGSADSNSGTSVGTTAQGTTPTQAAQAKHFKVGEVVKVGDNWQVTVTSAKTSKGQGFDQPKDGTVYLLIDVQLKNISSKEQNVSSLADFTLRDTSGQEYTETITSFAKAPDGKVEAGAPLKGEMVYEVPPSVHAFVFSFAPELFASGQTTWDIKA